MAKKKKTIYVVLMDNGYTGQKGKFIRAFSKRNHAKDFVFDKNIEFEDIAPKHHYYVSSRKLYQKYSIKKQKEMI